MLYELLLSLCAGVAAFALADGALASRLLALALAPLAYVYSWCTVYTLGGYAAFALYTSVERPRLYAHSRAAADELVAACPALRRYTPTPWLTLGLPAWLAGHTVTVGFFIRASWEGRLQFERTVVANTDSDGGVFAVDWAAQHREDRSRPVVLILHGLAGSSKSVYCQCLVHTLLARGFRCVVLNARGCGGVPLSTARGFTAAFTEDVRFAAKHVRREVGEGVPLYAVGFSLGSTILTKYLCEEGGATPLDAAIAVSPSFDMLITDATIMQPSYAVTYSKFLVSGLHKWATDLPQSIRRQLSSKDGVDWKVLAAQTTVRGFDEQTVCKIYGYANTFDYYRDASTRPLLMVRPASRAGTPPPQHTERLRCRQQLNAALGELTAARAERRRGQRDGSEHIARLDSSIAAQRARVSAIRAALRRSTPGVSVPLLAVSCAGDPICNSAGIPTDAPLINPNLTFVVTRHGGHTFWPSGLWPTRPTMWLEQLATEWLSSRPTHR